MENNSDNDVEEVEEEGIEDVENGAEEEEDDQDNEDNMEDGGEEEEQPATTWGALPEEDEQDVPEEIALRKPAMSLDLHPSRDLVVVGLIGGRVEVYNYVASEDRNVYSERIHSKTTKAARFSEDGRYLFSGSADKSLGVIDLETQVLLYRHDKAHQHGIYSILSHQHLLATGDDEGTIKLWDLRTRQSAFSFSECEDYISSMLISPEHNRLLATSADGTLSVIDLRNGKLEDRSDPLEDELLSIALIKNGSKVVCGSQSGTLNIYSWGLWGDISDRFPGHPESVDCLIPIDESTICTGSFDGFIRVVQIQPNKLLGVVGEHEENGIGIPIEHLRLSHDSSFLASTSHDQIVKFWDVRYLFEKQNEGEGEDEEEQQQPLLAKGKRLAESHGKDAGTEGKTSISSSSSSSSNNSTSNTQKKRRKGKNGFFGGL